MSRPSIGAGARDHRGAARPVSEVVDRRFEAVAFDWDGTAVADRSADAAEVRRLVEQLCSLGMEVVVVSGTHVGNVDGQLLARPEGPGHLHLCLNRGSEVFAVDRGGPRLVDSRVATPEEDAALTAAAEITVSRLAERGLEAAIVAQRVNRRKIDLIPLPEWADPPKARIDDLVLAVEARLRAAGILGLPEVVDLALEAAAEAGIPEPRVTSDAKHVEIGLTDKADSGRWIARYLADVGIGPGLVLLGGDEFGPLGGVAGSDSLLLVAELDRAVAISVGVEPSAVPDGVAHLGGGPAVFVAILADQLERRRRGDPPRADDDPRWSIAVDGLDEAHERAHESLLTIADGRMGTNGSPLLAHPASRPEVLAAGCYAGIAPADGLMAAPLWERLYGEPLDPSGLRRVLDMRAGLLEESMTSPWGSLASARFSSLARPGLCAIRVTADAGTLRRGPAVTPPGLGRATEDDDDGLTVRSADGSISVNARERWVSQDGAETVERLAAYTVGRPEDPTPEGAAKDLATEARRGFEPILVEHRTAWGARWKDADVRIAGDAALQQAVRFALFHLMASVADTGEAAVGARGLSGSGYGGHVFWDSDVFVLPFLAATHPAAARAMVEYRIRRLPAAREAAKALGRAGARFAWESATSGRDVTPRSARDMTGRLVPIRTGLLEEHISADVAWAACVYAEWSGDDAFLFGAGLPLVVETARYWASRIKVDGRGRGSHLRGHRPGRVPRVRRRQRVHQRHGPVEPPHGGTAHRGRRARGGGGRTPPVARGRRRAGRRLRPADEAVRAVRGLLPPRAPGDRRRGASPSGHRRPAAGPGAGPRHAGRQAGRRADAPSHDPRGDGAGIARSQPGVLRAADGARQLALTGHPRGAVRS